MASSAFKCTIIGAPRTKKNHGRTFRPKGKSYPIHMPSVAFERFENAALPQLRIARAGRGPIAGDVNVRATFYRDKNIGDAVGYYQALADVLEKAGVVENDRQIVSWDGTRLDKDAEKPRVELVIETVDWGAGVKHPYEE